ncbi:MAG: protein kinase, partial [Chloroflexi bacterium]|nr:protein kinase [Chloroflexota bacterium]
MTTPPNLLADRYELNGRIESEGAAEVWRAVDRQTGQPVTVRLLPERFSGNDAFADNFRREAQSAAALQHPNLVKALDYGREGGRLFLVEEPVEGSDLSVWLRAAPLPPPQALAILAQAAAGLAAAHSTGIVHGALRPAAVLIRADGVVKIADLALSRAMALSGIAETGQTAAAVIYHSPEQVQGRSTIPASDVYALGVLLFELLTGRPPYIGATPLDLALQQSREDAPPARSLRPELPWDVEALVARALARQPEARFADAAALWAALVRLSEYAPGTAITLPAARAAATATTTAMPTEPTDAADTPASDAPPAADAPAPPAEPSPRTIAAADNLPPQEPTPPLAAGTPVRRTTTAAPVLRAPGAAGPATVAPAAEDQPRAAGSNWGLIATMGALVVIGLLMGVGGVMGYRGVVSPVISGPRSTATPSAIIVPSVLGRSLEDARQVAQRQGLAIKVEERPDSGAEPNTVIDQDPPAGRSVQNGSTVRLIVSSAPPRVSAPNLMGLTLDDARGVLTRGGLSVGGVVERTSTPQDRGRVIGQFPAPGGSVAPNGAVELVVGDGAPVTAVPPTATAAPERATASA